MDKTDFENYLVEPEIGDIELAKSDIRIKGFDKWFEDYCHFNLDCTRVFANGWHVNQTIGYPYSHCLSACLDLIKLYAEENRKEDYINKLKEIHKANVEFEKINPPTWYGGEEEKKKYEKKKRTSKHRRVKQETINFGEEHKITAAERKLAARVAKINSLKINIKPI